MRTIVSVVGAAAFVTALAAPAAACPYCDAAVREQVWAGVFDGDFGRNLLVTAAPFVVFVALAAAIHGSGTERVPSPGGPPSDRPARPEQ